MKPESAHTLSPCPVCCAPVVGQRNKVYCGKACSNKAWHAANVDREKARKKAHRAANPERVKALIKAWKVANRDRANACKKARRAANPDREKAQAKTRYVVNADRVKSQVKAWRAANADRVKAQSKAWRVANSDRVKSRAKARYAANADRVSARNKAWDAANPEARRAKNHRRRARLKDGNSPGVSPAQWAGILESFAHRCAYCEQSSIKLTREHVRPIACGGIDAPENVVPACKSCNSSKGAKLLITFLWEIEGRRKCG